MKKASVHRRKKIIKRVKKENCIAIEDEKIETKSEESKEDKANEEKEEIQYEEINVEDEIEKIFKKIKKEKQKKKIKESVNKEKKQREKGRNYTEDGLPIYTEEELGMNNPKAGTTPLCPFECDCCH